MTPPTSRRVALVDEDALVVGGALVGAAELGDPVGLVGAVVVGDGDEVGGDLGDDTGLLGADDVAGVERGAELHAGADERRLGADQRHGLTLHVRAHERAVGVVVLEERDQRGRGRHHLARRDVHVVDVVAGDVARPRRPWCARARGPRRSGCPASSGALACAMTCSSSSSADR